MLRSHIAFAVLIFSLVVAYSFYSSLAFRYRPAVDEVCSIVLENYYDLNALQNFKDAYSLSVPIADYQNHKLVRLEDIGVPPNTFLNYKFADSLQGRDSWIDEILKMRHKQARDK